MAVTHHNRGLLLRQAAKLREAESAFAEALAYRRRLAKPGPRDRSLLGPTLHNLPPLARARGQLDPAPKPPEGAVKEQSAAHNAAPSVAGYLEGLREHRAALAETLLAVKDHAGAARAAVEMTKTRSEKWLDAFEGARLVARCAALAEEDEGKTEE